MSSLPERPSAVTGASCGAFTGSAVVGVLLLLSDRGPTVLAVSAGIAAVGAVVAVFPMRAGRAWARVALFVSALLGVLTAPAVAVTLPAPGDLVVGTALALVWSAVLWLMLRPGVRDFCAGPARGHERLTG
ncbi:hypothetical protein ACTG9Q_03640 [Actinokineospora sp. 24-640]